MQTGVLDLYIATNIDDLKAVAYPKSLGKNITKIENVAKSLYHAIMKETTDQEKCYIHCLRYKFSINTICKYGDKKFYDIYYASEIAKVDAKIEELNLILRKRYQLQNKENNINLNNKKVKKQQINNHQCLLTAKKHLFEKEFISVSELHSAIQENLNILLVDVRLENEYLESRVIFENVINIPEDIIMPGLSANKLGEKLNGETQKIWEKRDTFDAIVFVDWCSNEENITCSKLKYLKDAIVEWDLLRKYKQHPVIISGGFKEFLDTYPWSVTNVHVNFIRNNEDIDELLELDSISYPEPDQNVSIMPLKQFTIEELEESAKTDNIIESDDEEDEENQIEEEEHPGDNVEPSKSKSAEDNLPLIMPERITKPDINYFNEKDADIKGKIEEEKRKLLQEARNLKKKKVDYNDNNKENVVEDHVGDIVEYKKIIPPPIRRDTKPKKMDIILGGWCGLVNIKNTCYMNTILQCLKCIPIIRSIVHSRYDKHITNQPSLIFDAFAAVVRVLCQGSEYDKKSYRPSAFYEIVCRLDAVYKKGNHEDCMEFFLFLFNYLNDDCSCDIRKKTVMTEREKAWYIQLQGRTSLWVDLFYHQFKCTKICQTCHSKADSYETDNTIMLPVPYKVGLRMVHLKDLINEYLEDNQILDYKCSKCKNLGVINKKEVVVAPEILVLVLKRYYQDEYQESRKNNVCVDFDSTFSFGNANYMLYSIAEHRGTMDHGHYFAHGILNDTKTWIEFNDERISDYAGDFNNIRGAACAFFYCKKSSN